MFIGASNVRKIDIKILTLSLPKPNLEFTSVSNFKSCVVDETLVSDYLNESY